MYRTSPDAMARRTVRAFTPNNLAASETETRIGSFIQRNVSMVTLFVNTSVDK